MAWLRGCPDLRSNPPTLATWERQRTDMEAAYVVIVSNHWVAVRGNWFCDSFTYGVPVKIKDAPHRRKRVRFVYVVSVAPIRTQPRADRLGPKSAAPR